MFELCPCLDSLYAGVPDEIALRSLADLGFRHFEFWDWRTHDLEVLAGARAAYGLHPVVFSANTFAEPLVSTRAHPAALTQIRQSVAQAARLGTTALVIHVGYAAAGDTREKQWEAAVAALRRGGDLAAEAGVQLLVEPLNSAVDHPGYFLDSLSQARRLLEEAHHPSIRLLLDVYHLWVMHPDLLADLPDVLAITGHVHLADAPGRHEPGTGTIPWPAVMNLLSDGGYRGLLGLEYFPSTDVSLSLLASRRVLGLESRDTRDAHRRSGTR